jgi:murein DD-endopeptidase MepM/ murein hydrolase activator NlpD
MHKDFYYTMFSKGRILTGLAGLVMWCGFSSQVLAQGEHEISLILPSENEAIFEEGGGPEFYMHTYRQERPGEQPGWTAGKYGFVRNVRRTSAGVIYSRFHEGIDIRPMRRSRRGDPIDEISAIAEGEVVYVNNGAGRSNYGRYIVIEHQWGESPYYSLYAHLSRVSVSVGDWVDQGNVIGVMGYTGRGVNRARAHLHLEVNLMLNESFNDWYDDYLRNAAPNYHGIFNGINLTGVDIAQLYLKLQENPDLTMPEFFQETGTPFFEVTIPVEAAIPNMLWRYPWLCPELEGWRPDYGTPLEMGNSWKITFAASGLPLKFEPSDDVLDEPKLNVLQRSNIPYQYLTNGLVRGRGNDFSLTTSGLRRIDLISRPDLNHREPE